MSNVAPSTATSLQGKEWKISSPADCAQALDAAFDYRGDITLVLTSGQSVEGYVFNRDNGRVQLYLKGSDKPHVLQASEVASIIFSGKDPADGKSFDVWKSKKEGERRAEAEKVEDELRLQGYL